MSELFDTDEKTPTPKVDAFSRIVQIISRFPKTSSELRTKLIREGYASRDVEDALNRACDCLLVNDEAYAQSYTLSKQSASYGRFRIKQDLLRKGINVEEYEFWDELQTEDAADEEFVNALAFAQRHIPHSKHPGKSLFQALIRRGYSASCAYKVLEALGINPYQ